MPAMSLLISEALARDELNSCFNLKVFICSFVQCLCCSYSAHALVFEHFYFRQDRLRHGRMNSTDSKNN